MSALNKTYRNLASAIQRKANLDSRRCPAAEKEARAIIARLAVAWRLRQREESQAWPVLDPATRAAIRRASAESARRSRPSRAKSAIITKILKLTSRNP